MANTTNFGWETPDDTDLVKDGAAAMRTLGNSIDASFVDLKGGTTGQILSKNSNTDLDYIWINNDQGDITAVTAGTGISGGGTSGAVTITNSMATEITASGDIIVGTGSGTFDNLPIGTTGQVLTADTTVSPYKVKWATAAGGSLTPYCAVNANGTTITDNVATEAVFSNENFDSDNAYNTSTGRFTPQTAGKYFVISNINLYANGVNIWHQGTISLRKNGTEFARCEADFYSSYAVYGLPMTIASIIDCNGTTDYISTFVTLNVTSGGTPNYAGASRMTIYRIGA